MSANKTVCVCVVEDDEWVRGQLVAAISKEGHCVEAFGNFEAARRLFQATPRPRFDVLVTQIGTNGEGFDLDERVRQTCPNRFIRTIFYTAHSRESFGKLAEEKGSNVIGRHGQYASKDTPADEIARLVGVPLMAAEYAS